MEGHPSRRSSLLATQPSRGWVRRRLGRLLLTLFAGLGLAWAGPPAAAPQPLPAPPGAFAFRSYGPEQGLTNLSVNALAQDRDGFLWIGTEDGLFRLEGAQMRRFGTEDGLPDAYIDGSGLAPTADGGLWVLTRKGAVLWQGDRFLAPSALGHPAWDGKVGIALSAGALVLNDGKHNRALFSGDGPPKPLEGLPKVPGMSPGGWMSQDRRELLLMVAGRLYRLQDGIWSSRDLAGLAHGTLQCVLKDRQGRIWVRSERGLVRFASFDGPAEDLSRRVELSISNTSSLVEDAQGLVWTNTAGSLAWFGAAEAGLLSEANGLPQGGANVLLLDREQNLWIGGEGLHRQLGRLAWEGYTRRQGLPAHVVWSLFRSGDGLLWAGTSAGLAAGDRSGWTLLPGSSQRQFMAFTQDRGGQVWAAPQMGLGEATWILLRRPGARTGERVALPGLKPGTSATALAAGPDGSLWVGTDQAGLQRLSRRGGGWSLEPLAVPGWPQGDTSISSLLALAPDQIWVSGSRGVAFFDGRDWRNAGKAQGLFDEDVLCAASDRPGEAWVAFRSARALCRVKAVGAGLQVVETIKPPHPLLGQPINSMRFDSAGTLWLGSSLGLLRWDGTRIERFGKAWGLPGEDCAQNALWIDPNGDAWVGLSVGIARFRAERHRTPAPPPEARLRRILDGAGAAVPGTAERLRIPYGRRTIAFEYLADTFSLGDAPRFQVRLLGFEDDWRTTALPEARYPGLPAGAFRFEVRVLDPLGVPGPVAGTDLRILTPWWQTWLFRLGATGALAVLGLLGFRWRTRILRRRNEELERVVATRTEALAEANRALEEMSMGDPLTHLRNRRYLGMIMPEEIAGVLRIFQRHLQRNEDPFGRNEDLLVLMIDLDRFKLVNDAYGHRAGDEVLRQTGDLLREVCRESDILVRWGGEEFLVLARRANRENGAVIARNILEAVRSRPFLLPDGQTIHCTCCIGYTAFPVLPGEPEAFRWEEAVEVADQCLYLAKNSGRDGWIGAYCDTLRGAEGLKPGLLTDLRAHVLAGDFQLRTSLPELPRLRWKDYAL